MGRYAGKALGSRCWIVGAVVGLALVLAHPVNAAAQEALTATVTRVIDGDTVEVQLASGAPTTVRLLGIDAPESVAPGTPVECGSEEAAAYLTEFFVRTGGKMRVGALGGLNDDLPDNKIEFFPDDLPADELAEFRRSIAGRTERQTFLQPHPSRRVLVPPLEVGIVA